MTGPPPPPSPAAWTLIYDGDCAFCSMWVRRLGSWDRLGRVRPVRSRDRAARGGTGLPPISDAALDEAMHLVAPDGTIFVGGNAVPRILALLPVGRFLAPLFAIPGAQRLANVGYRWVARHRHQLPGGTAACGMDR